MRSSADAGFMVSRKLLDQPLRPHCFLNLGTHSHAVNIGFDVRPFGEVDVHKARPAQHGEKIGIFNIHGADTAELVLWSPRSGTVSTPHVGHLEGKYFDAVAVVDNHRPIRPGFTQEAVVLEP
jgi:hypothetical protein